MRQVTRKGLMTVAAATGVIAATGGAAHADSGASGSSTNSPGVLSGNSVQAPVNAPVNVCGNTVNVVGLLNPAMGNKCVNTGVKSGGGSGSSGGYGDSGSGGSEAGGHTGGSPGVGSGNHVEAPIDAPVNVCGNSVDVIGIGNSTTANDCANEGGSGGTEPDEGGQETPPGSPEQPGNPVEPGRPGAPNTPPPGPGVETPVGSHPNQPGAQSFTQPRAAAQLAHTGSDLPMGLALPVGAGALLAGVTLYRKARASA
ncbi:chaplin [Streptomyces sp. NBC_01352]|uniref:chaplin n=1 Tax=Streptomyces sp. NBC_01352 TaxID=2903834 RepID=UPI002E342C51|nr:chaplin [Streptomyces sp. NBC_01352]